MSSELASLRSTLQGLQSYELPAIYRLDSQNDPNNNDNANNGANDDKDKGNGDGESSTAAPLFFHTPQLLQRYKSARNTYIQQRTLELFLNSLQKYDRESNTLPLPDRPDDDAEEELRRRQEEVLGQIKGTLDKMTGDMDDVRAKWEQFREKREELAQIVDGMERGERRRRLEGGGDDDKENNANHNTGAMGEMIGEGGRNGGGGADDDGITDEDVSRQEERLDELRRRRAVLEERLRAVRAEASDVEDDCHASKRTVNEVRARGGRKPLDWRGAAVGSQNGSGNGEVGGEDGDKEDEEADAEYISVIARGVQVEIAEMEEKAVGMKKSSEFYGDIRELVEELGGVKILSSRSLPGLGGDGGESPEKRRKLDNGGGFVVTFLLLEKHVLEITLSRSSSGGDGDALRVVDAQLTTSAAFPLPETSTDGEKDGDEATASLEETMHSISLSNQSFSKIMSQKPSAGVTVPPLNDLVRWSCSLEGSPSSSSSRAIRFVISETVGRLRASKARADALAALRERYAAHVYDVDPAAAEQEAVCAVNEGVAVALRLGADCPLTPGSVYVSEIFGVGGWEQGQLEELKGAVKRKRCRGPVEAMECLVEEIRRRSEEGGWVVPATPLLPRRHKE